MKKWCSNMPEWRYAQYQQLTMEQLIESLPDVKPGDYIESINVYWDNIRKAWIFCYTMVSNTPNPRYEKEITRLKNPKEISLRKPGVKKK